MNSIYTKRFWPAVVWIAVIVTLCGIPGNDLPSANWMEAIYLDKWVHLGMFFLLFVLWYWPLRTNVKWTIRKSTLTTWLICLVVAAGTEILQAYVFKMRDADVFDFLTDCLGSFLGTIFVSFQRF